jgi:uncharacterized protein involved in outer membrane biogenesis
MGVRPAIKPGNETFRRAAGLSCFCIDACLRHTPAMDLASLKQNKWVRRGIVALLVLLALWVIAWLAVPPIAKSQLQKIASEKLGRQVTVGKIDFKPWTLELALHDLRIATADGKQPQLAIKRIYADAELQSLFRLAPVIDAVSVESPAILLTHQADGKYDIDDILAKLASGPPPDPKAEPARFAIYNISIKDGAVDFDDQTVKRKHELRELRAQCAFPEQPGLAARGQDRAQAGLHAQRQQVRFGRLHHALRGQAARPTPTCSSRASTSCLTSATSQAACR